MTIYKFKTLKSHHDNLNDNGVILVYFVSAVIDKAQLSRSREQARSRERPFSRLAITRPFARTVRFRDPNYHDNFFGSYR